ncbi:hypothetical protein GCM10011391_14990 [Pullulanibacillus camelliae]|uniref:Uncharacterized protein n=1 Tax=Pullulanibacillus camelliae TaxID=1707096 RepID=A0A8J2VLS4_9BACL|nr:YrvL family regulatory protein [Pullulanibacillus camelliae]GGE37099.1 hypothetical protein GCM10011391_14990 [Pullulanibacillus camelliae]
MSHDYGKFTNLRFRDKLVVIIGIGIIIGIALAIIFGCFFFGIVGFFSLIGVTYDSHMSLILFVALCLIINSLLEILSKGIMTKLWKDKKASLTRGVLAVVMNSLIMLYVVHKIDEGMSSIQLIRWAEWEFVLLITVVNIVFNEKKRARLIRGK